MSRWSSPGDAYDAHMTRWAAVAAGEQAAADAATSNRARFKLNADRHKVLFHWRDFAATWGRGPHLGDVDAKALWFMRRENAMLFAATTHHMSATAADKISVAADLAEPEPLHLTDLHDRTGFMVLETPVLLPDINPVTGEVDNRILMPVRAIGGEILDEIDTVDADGSRCVRPGVMLYVYSTADDYAGVYRTSLSAATGIDPGPSTKLNWARDDLFIVDVCPWAFGSEWGSRSDLGEAKVSIASNISYLRRWFFTFARFCWQELLVAEPRAVSPKSAGRWAHQRWQRPPSDVTVMRLRRPLKQQTKQRHDGLATTLDHRVIVRAHWRRQWFGSLGLAYAADGVWNPSSHRLVWVDEHWRGPGDGPIGATRHMTVVAR